MPITEKQFKRFVKVQQSGSYNMISKEAQLFAGLTKDEHMDILNNYDKYDNKWSE